MSLPVYSRAHLSRTVALVVALSLTAVSTGAVAREIRAADTRSEVYPAAQALHCMSRVSAEKSGGRRIRAQQSESMSDMIRGLGADPFELPYGQVLTGLATKPVNGAENNRPSFVTTDHDRHAGYDTLAAHTISPEAPVMSAQPIERIRKVE